MHWAVRKFETLEQNGKCYYIVFDELTDIYMYLYIVVRDRNTPVVEKTIMRSSLEGGGH